MRLGVFAKTYARDSVDEVFAAAARDGFRCVQFNLACAGLPTLPEDPVPGPITREILRAASRHGVEIAAVSGTFNMAHPQAAVRRDGGRRLRHVIDWAETAGVPVVTLCTGTRDPEDLWREHPGNASPQAWDDFIEALTPALAAAAQAGVTLAVEPEPANVVSDAPTARRLLDGVRSAHLKIILDPANLARPAAPEGDRELLAEAVRALAGEAVLVHAKDRRADGSVCPAGQGVVAFAPFLGGLQRAGYDGPLVIHGIGERELPTAAGHLRAVLSSLNPEGTDAFP